ncbi:MAG: Flp pilus assembly complex ATPase component TadA [Magnetococcales bacterium]|nr:Flp pilus assembly complex ATPase component TadA [Magnetococcales bacterium]
MAQQRRKVRIGDALVNEGIITEEQLQKALAEQKKTGKKLGQTLAYLGIMPEQKFLEFLSQQLDVPFVDLKQINISADIFQKIPETMARRFRAVALAEGADGILVGMADPTDIFVFDELTRLMKRPPRVAMVSESDLLRVMDRMYRRTDDIREQAKALGEELGDASFSIDQIVQSEMVVDAPVVKIMQSLFEDAIQMGASDIHIEPDETLLRIRQRIDGILNEQIVKEKQIAPALVSKIKLMAGLEIAEKRLPQDGRFNMKVRDRTVDVRVSTLPTQYGESVVMRLLDQSSANLDLDRVGMDAYILRRFRYYIERPHGLILVTGPTGSGKTTTLYGALNALNVAERKIITIEDPVEYRLNRINQVQIHAKIGLTFASVLRTVLRQDPDVVLVGEMRDRETAEIAIKAAMTGHLVLSTLHTNDAVSTAIRLVDMGAESFSVASALRCILAQRLIRRVCRDCARPYLPEEHEQILIQGMLGQDSPDTSRMLRGAGCSQCNQSGYRGRIAAIELLEVKGELARALSRGDTGGFIDVARQQRGYVPLPHAAMQFALRGLTTLEEAMKLTTELDDPEEMAEAAPTTKPAVAS